ncbi:MAG: tyrosine-type recombinase/integrase [Akkermansiaceae bacterium]|nr:tyrosine-type recombinase/integrase [Akkermansiaceae bacterium]
MRRYLDRAGITTPGGPHLMRHSCATHMHDRGAPLRGIQRILGHSRLDTTAIYTHVSTAKLVEFHARYHPHGDLASTTGCPEVPRSSAIQDRAIQAQNAAPKGETDPN